MLRRLPGLTSPARAALAVLVATAIPLGWQATADASSTATTSPTTASAPPTTTSPATALPSTCHPTYCVYDKVGVSALHVPTGVQLLRVQVVGTSKGPAVAKAARDVEVRGNVAVSSAETTLRIVVGRADAYGGARSLIEAVGPAGPRVLAAVGGDSAPRSKALPSIAAAAKAAEEKAAEATKAAERRAEREKAEAERAAAAAAEAPRPKTTLLPPAGDVVATAKPPSVVFSWVPPGTAPAILGVSRPHLYEGVAAALTVTARAATPPSVTEDGALPKGTSWKDNGNGTASLSGTPLAPGSYPITITVTVTDPTGASTHERVDLGVAARPVPTKPVTTPTTAPPTTAPPTTAPPTTTAPAPVTTTPPTTVPPPTTTPPTTVAPTTTAPTTTVPPTTVPAPTTTAPRPTTTTPPTTAPRTTTPTTTPPKPATTHPTTTHHTSKPTTPALVTPAFTSPSSASFAIATGVDFEITATGTPTPAIGVQGTLPQGLTFQATTAGTATITGTPTQPGEFALDLTAGNGRTVTQHFVLTVTAPPALTSASTATFESGTATTFSVIATGTPTPEIREDGPLPSGLTFQADGSGTATISGTTSEQGDYPVTLTATNSLGETASQHLSIEVAEAPFMTTGANATFTAGEAGKFMFAAGGFPVPAMSVEGDLPPGLRFTDNADGTATLAGTPTRAGNYSVKVVAKSSDGMSTMQPVHITVMFTPTTTKLSYRRVDTTPTANVLELTAVVDPPGSVPQGTVTFLDEDQRLGSARLDAEGTAMLRVRVALGEHVLSASYAPAEGSGFSSSSSTPHQYLAETAIPHGSGTPAGGSGASVTRADVIGGAVVVLIAAALGAWALNTRRRRPGRLT